ncbi:MAG: flippase-like domain-containing protein [Lachnospiraceae bacterium]|nr:flippase-like domain-containing protein [Lachnospiraceae bacterium]
MKRRTLARIIFVAVLILIIIYTFWGSWQDILERVVETAPRILILILAASAAYEVIEGWIIYTMGRLYNPDLRFYQAVYCAFYASFYRLSTLGIGSGFAAIAYLGRNGLSYSEATGMYMFIYTLHKISIAGFSGIFFLLNWSEMVSNYHRYGVYLILAYILTAIIAIFFAMLIVFPPFHKVILRLLRLVNFRNRLDNIIERVEEELKIMEETAPHLLKNVRVIVTTVLRDFLKLLCWYSIPFMVLLSTGGVTLKMSYGVTSLAVTTAAVIPTPAGIGSSELIMSGLYSLLVGVENATAATLLYRTATFIFPFVVGAVLILIAHLFGRRKKKVVMEGGEA